MLFKCAEEDFGENFLRKKQFLLFFFDCERTRSFGKKFESGLSELHFMTPYEDFGFLKQREHVHRELANSAQKVNILRKRFSSRNLNSDGK